MRAQHSVIQPEPGDVYETCDGRRTKRRLKVVRVWGQGGEWPRVLMRNLKTGRLSTVSIDLLRPGSRGYRRTRKLPSEAGL